ncbi:M14-type cytosolic carboxypeptidase [Paraphotobacterium marinum]|uniref:M14 family metallopeptidase n=1 Tax=Paraphotobacterium marinum TaxID=1755811 RepID=UPI0039EAE070
MLIDDNFDSGNIKVISQTDRNNIQLEIKKDNMSDFFQWFHFKVELKQLEALSFSINNLETSAYPLGWENYNVVATYDKKDYFRIPSCYNNGQLSFSLKPKHSTIYLSYFAPYSYDRHLELLAQYQSKDNVRLETLGKTFDGRDISLLNIGRYDSNKKNIWIIARQHPGETMAEWFIEGLLEKLFNPHSSVSLNLLKEANIFVVPNMNPDGSVRGHLRTNAKGINLNREWQEPSIDKSPEVYFVRQKMLETGVDMFLDIHGDEAIPFNFIDGCEGTPSYDAKMADLENTFKENLKIITPDFQTQYGYEVDQYGEANLTVGSKWVGENFKCLSLTVEMPFKDHDSQAQPQFGWSPERSKNYGQDMLTAINTVIKDL